MPYPDNTPCRFLVEEQFPAADRDFETFLALKDLTIKARSSLAEIFQIYLKEAKSVAGKSETSLLRKRAKEFLTELTDYAEYNIVLYLEETWNSHFPHNNEKTAELLEESAYEESQE